METAGPGTKPGLWRFVGSFIRQRTGRGLEGKGEQPQAPHAPQAEGQSAQGAPEPVSKPAAAGPGEGDLSLFLAGGVGCSEYGLLQSLKVGFHLRVRAADLPH